MTLESQSPTVDPNADPVTDLEGLVPPPSELETAEAGGGFAGAVQDFCRTRRELLMRAAGG